MPTTKKAEPRPHAFGTRYGRCVLCGVHRDDPKAAEPCTPTTTAAGIINLGV